MRKKINYYYIIVDFKFQWYVMPQFVYIFVFTAEKGPAVGRLLVEVMELVDFDVHGHLVCEMQVGSQRQSTPPSPGPPFKFNMSTQFVVRQIKNEAVLLNLVVFNRYSPDGKSLSLCPVLHGIAFSIPSHLSVRFGMNIMY